MRGAEALLLCSSGLGATRPGFASWLHHRHRLGGCLVTVLASSSFGDCLVTVLASSSYPSVFCGGGLSWLASSFRLPTLGATARRGDAPSQLH